MRAFQGSTSKILLLVLALVLIFLCNLPLARLQLMSPDASEYLDIGRHFLAGRATFSYNLYQYWPGKHYPALPFLPPIYPLFAGLIWLLTHSVAMVIAANLLLLILNCFLLYKICRLYYDYWLSLFIVVYLGFSKIMVFAAINPWTEQLHLLFILLPIYLYLRWQRYHFWLGILLALSCLVRFASFYNVCAFGLALGVLKGFSRQALREYILIGLGFILVFLPYEGWCYFRYGAFYPQYLAAFTSFKSAEVYPGAFYQNGMPVLNTPVVKVARDLLLSQLYRPLLAFFNVFEQLRFVFLLIPLYLIFSPPSRRQPLLIFFLCQAVGVMLGHALSNPFGQVRVTFTKNDAWRYALIPFLTLCTMGLLLLKELQQRLTAKKKHKHLITGVFLLVMALLFGWELKSYLGFRQYFLTTFVQQRRGYEKIREELVAWIKNETKEDDLIASALMRDAFYFERPVVSLPEGQARNEKNLVDYLKIFQPTYLITSDTGLIDYLRRLNFQEKKRSGNFVILGRTE